MASSEQSCARGTINRVVKGNFDGKEVLALKEILALFYGDSERIGMLREFSRGSRLSSWFAG
jgi:hypothetical protein